MDANQQNQNELQQDFNECSIPIENLHYVAGSVLIFREDLNMFVGSFVVIDVQNHSKLIYQKTIELKFDDPCPPQFLVVRETPIIAELFADFCASMPNIDIDVLLISGPSENSLFGTGLADSVGLEIDIPTIQIFNSFVFTDSSKNEEGIHAMAKNELNAIGNSKIITETRPDGTTKQYAVMRTSYEKPVNEIIVLPGFRITAEQSIEIVGRLNFFRLPEPIRLADMITRKYIEEKIDNKLTVVPDVPESGHPPPPPPPMNNQSPAPSRVAVATTNQVFHLIIALDCTGSMGSAIMSIKSSLNDFIQIIKCQYPSILISFYAIRDYCDKKVVNKSLFMNQTTDALNAVAHEIANGGGDTPEAHKTGLAEIYDDVSKKEGMTNVCIFITDAPPHLYEYSSGNPQKEMRFFQDKKWEFAMNWIDLAHSLDSLGIQVFSFLVSDCDTVQPFSVLSQLTHALCFKIPNEQEKFIKQMKSIINNLINHNDATVVNGITMIQTDDDISNITKEIEIKKVQTHQVTDVQEIKEALTEKALLMRLSPTERGAKRVIISSKDLVKQSENTINALKALYSIVKGDSSQFEFLESSNMFKNIAKQLREANPTEAWLTESTSSCIFSMMTLADAFEELMAFDVNTAVDTNDIVGIFEQLGNFVIGYPFLFELAEDGKFNMQDAWPIVLKAVSTSYTMSLHSLFDIIEHDETPSEEIISQFKDLIDKSQRSGIVPLCPDKLTSFVLKILDVTKWLDALISFGLHRHIEPLPSTTRATCSAFLQKLSYAAFQNEGFTDHEREALQLIMGTFDAMETTACKEMMEMFKSCIAKEEIPFSAFAPQKPYNCSAINKIINCLFQLKPLIKTANREYMIQFFTLVLSEILHLMSKGLDETKRSNISSKIYPPYQVDINNVEERNPLELDAPTEFTLEAFPFNIIEPNQAIKFSFFFVQTVWSLLRDDQFPELSPLLITAFLSEIAIIKPRSFKFEKFATDDDGNDLYQIKPIFATLDPNELIRNIGFVYYKQSNLDNLLQLAENRKTYLIKAIIDLLVIDFRNLDMELFHRHLSEGMQLHWMDKPFTLTMTQSGQLLNELINQVPKPQGSIEFYKNIISLLANGQDLSESYTWQHGIATFRDANVIKNFVIHFCQGDEEFLDQLIKVNARPTPNRHYHHKIYCPFSEEYTEGYARSRIICAIAPFYFSPSLPSIVSQIPPVLIITLSHKIGAPKVSEIKEFAKQIHAEMEALVPK